MSACEAASCNSWDGTCLAVVGQRRRLPARPGGFGAETGSEALHVHWVWFLIMRFGLVAEISTLRWTGCCTYSEGFNQRQSFALTSPSESRNAARRPRGQVGVTAKKAPATALKWRSLRSSPGDQFMCACRAFCVSKRVRASERLASLLIDVLQGH